MNHIQRLLAASAGTLLLAACGGGGGGSTPPVTTKTATIAFNVVSTAKLPAPVQGVQLTATLPAGTTVATDAGTKAISTSALVAGSGITSANKQVFGNYSGGKVTITVVTPEDTFRGGELAKLTLSYQSTTTLAAGDFAAPTLSQAFGHDTTTSSDMDLLGKLQAALGVTFN